MTKCGNFGACIYNTTAGCISPFNCPYKIEEEIITTATSTPLSPIGINTTETNKDAEIARLTAENERLSKQLTDGKCVYLSDNETAEGCVQSPCPNYKTVEDILKENAELTARLDKAVILPCKVGDTVWFFDSDRILKEGKISMLQCKSDGNWKMRITYSLVSYKTVFDDYCNKLGIKYFTDRAKAEARLAELKGGEGN